MDPLQWKDGLFYEDGHPTSMISGEFHYFRVPKADWQDRLRKWKDAGGTAVATYIPWLIHEPEEGRYSFSQHEYDDLEGFLQTCQEEGVQVIVRPGPYQYSELRWSGLPRWLCENYPKLRAKKLGGGDIGSQSISYTHPLFLEKAEKWIRKVCGILAPWSAGRGGPITAVQLDNEAVGIHTWFNGGWYDYNPDTFGFSDPEGRWPQFLQRKYKTVEALSAAWECPAASFAGAMPICRQAESLGDIRRLRDYEHCYLQQIAEYLATLRQWMRESGLELPYLHNSPNPSANAWFFETAERLGEGFLLGSDHYYNLGQNWQHNNPTPQYALEKYISLEVLRNMGMPPTVFEMPSGSASDWPPILPNDAEAAYLTNLAYGVKGWNYYIYTGGPNVPGTGATTDLYDYGAPVAADGRCRPLYYVQKKVHDLNRRYSLAESRLQYDFFLGYDREMLRSDSYKGWEGFFTPGKAWKLACDGLMTTALCSGLTPGLVDLTQAVPDRGKPLAVVTGKVLARAAQENLAEFVLGGGRLMIGPGLPELDEELRPCTILADAVGLVPSDLCLEENAIVDMAGVPNIRNAMAVVIRKEEALETLAHIRQGLLPEPAGEGAKKIAALYRAGEGLLLWNGLGWVHAQHEHNAALEQFLAALGMVPMVEKSERNLFTAVHRLPGRQLLFVLNLYSSPQTTDIRLRTPAGTAEFPGLELAPMEVRVLTVDS